MSIKKISTILLTIFIFQSNLSLAFDATYVWSELDSPAVSTNASVVSDNSNSLKLESASAVLMEQSSGKILYNHNMHEKLRPASVTKIMTILLIMEALDSGKINYADKVPCSEHAASMGGSQIWLDTTEELTVDEMLKAICVVSANDCTVAMAEFLAGSEELFVQQMNQKAKQLGMKDTTFKNCHGIDEDGHVTSSYDIALMSRELLKNHSSITKYTTIWMDSLRDGKSELVSTNKLIRNYSGATGLKTGSTSLALYNLSATATRNNLSLIAVVMKAPTTAIRFSEAKKLLDYGFNTYQYKEFGNKGDFVQTVPVQRGIQESVNLIYETNTGCLIRKGQEKNIEKKITIYENISAPIAAGDKLGEVSFVLGDTEINKVNLVSQNDVKKIGTWEIITYTLSHWFSLCRT